MNGYNIEEHETSSPTKRQLPTTPQGDLGSHEQP